MFVPRLALLLTVSAAVGAPLTTAGYQTKTSPR